MEYINELQQVLQSLESKKQRKAAYNEVLSPRFVSSPRKPPLSLPISPRTPQSNSPYKPWMQFNSSLPSPVDPSPCNSSASSSINDAVNELVATSKSAVAEVEVKFSGPNLLLKTVSHRIPGQVAKIVSALEQLALEILHVSITTVDETMLYSFTIKVIPPFLLYFPFWNNIFLLLSLIKFYFPFLIFLLPCVPFFILYIFLLFKFD